MWVGQDISGRYDHLFSVWHHCSAKWSHCQVLLRWLLLL